jgi:amidase
LRVGLRTESAGRIAPTDPTCVAAAEDAAALLESLGHAVEVAAPAAFDEAEMVETFSAIMFASLAAELAEWELTLGRSFTSEDVEPATWMYNELATNVSGASYVRALHAAHRWARRVVSWWFDDGFDVLLTPTLAEPPPEIGDVAARADDPLRAITRALPFASYTAPFNITGQPAMSLPTSWSDAGLPIGVQLVAAPFREDVLVRLAAQVEAARPWAARRPPVFA